MQIEIINDDHSCPNCYYRYFDSKAYPCSMCVCGEERKDMFKAKIAEQNEPRTILEANLYTDKDGDVWEWRDNAWHCISQTEPSGERRE